jgi:SAM-dependent methyltransferase
MQAYTGFAQVYDIFMDNVPYDEWTIYLKELLNENGIKEGLLLELGCGTGNITRRLAAKGYDMIGIDNSWEMLEIAREKEYEAGYKTEDEDFSDSSYETLVEDLEESNNEARMEELGVNVASSILYLQQDMREFELYGTVAAVVSICDSMNYITTEKDLLSVFRLVNNYLDPGGIFIFDMNTEYKYKNLLSNNVIAENRDECSFIWENYYDEETLLNEYNVTIFVRLEEEDNEQDSEQDSDMEFDEKANLFERFQETHYQKAYSLDTIKKILEKAGLEFLQVYDAFTHNPPTEKSERVYFVAKEKYQDNKKYI